MTVFSDIRAELEQTPADRKVIIRVIWDWTDPPVDHYREYLTTAGEFLAVLSGASIPRPVVKMRVNTSAGLRRRTKPVDGTVIKVEPYGTILDCYDDSTVSGWIEATVGGWLSVQYLTPVT